MGKPYSKQIVDLATPISFLPERLQHRAGALRVQTHLLNALNALNEAAAYADDDIRDRYLLGLTVARALYEGILGPDQLAEDLRGLRKPAERLLETAQLRAQEQPDNADAGPTAGLAPLDEHSLARSKEAFLARVYQYTDALIAENEHSRSAAHGERIERGFSFKRLMEIADAERVPAADTASDRADELAILLIGDLVWESRFVTLHPTAVRYDQTSQRIDRLSRLLLYLMVQGAADADRVAKVALLILGVPADQLDGYFSPKTIRTAHALAFPKKP